MTLDGKAAFVTGASRGIGAAVARSLSAAGVSVGLASRSGDDLGLPDAIGVRCNVADPAEVSSAVAATVERFGRLDILVANAGVGAYGPFLELSPDFLEEMIDVNLKGTLYAVRAALPYLLESGEADIVTLASEAGRRGLPYEAVYCASKFGQVGFTAGARPRAPRAGHPLHERLPRRRRDRLRAGRGPRPDGPTSSQG